MEMPCLKIIKDYLLSQNKQQEAQRTQLLKFIKKVKHQMVLSLKFKPVASKVHVRSVNAQANLMSNSCQGDAI
jgi:hypothetical protein